MPTKCLLCRRCRTKWLAEGDARHVRSRLGLSGKSWPERAKQHQVGERFTTNSSEATGLCGFSKSFRHDRRREASAFQLLDLPRSCRGISPAALSNDCQLVRASFAVSSDPARFCGNGVNGASYCGQQSSLRLSYAIDPRRRNNRDQSEDLSWNC